MFRRATISDIPVLTRLINVAYEVEKFFKIGDRTDETEIAAMLDQSAFLVHEQGGKIVGCVHVIVNGERGYFGLLAVLPEKRDQRLGARLVSPLSTFVPSSPLSTALWVMPSVRPRPFLTLNAPPSLVI
jgi:N-acetylglutamate synthase-like GNAT family acetyltransferase